MVFADSLNERRVCATSNGSVCHWCLFGRVAMVYAVNPQRTKVLEEIRHELYIAAIYVGQNNPKIDAVKQLVRPALVCGPQFSNVAKIFPSNVATGLVR